MVRLRQRLPGDVESAAVARRQLREVLTRAAHEEWLDNAELALSEVVTNVVLHAHTDLELHLLVHLDHLCVEVRDFDPTVPVPRDYNEDATTGRGMGLVAALAAGCGVESLGDDGKITWFTISEQAAPTEEDLLSAWDLEGDWDIAEIAPERLEVALESLPAGLWLSARQHHDAIVRELSLYLAAHPDPGLDVAAADHARSLISVAVVNAVDNAHEAGAERARTPLTSAVWVPAHLDLVVAVPEDVVLGFAAMQRVLDRAESLATADLLLVRPGLPEIVAVRNWVCHEVLAQADGAAPTPWPGTALERFETTLHEEATPRLPRWDPAVVEETQRAVVAADDANRIIGVSASLAALLGWEVEDLIGRRVTALVPAPYREAHIAGFSRYLSTGQARILGQELELPVARRDGTELVCRVVIKRVALVAGRSVFVAWFDPLSSDPSTRHIG